MLIEGKVGPQTLTDGAFGNVRQGKAGEVIVGDLGLGAYSESVNRGLVFFACTQAGVATTAGLGAAATGIILTNPVGSGKSLLVLRFHGAITAAPAGAAPLGLAMGTFNSTAVVHGTPLTVRNAKGGTTVVGVGLADSAATLPATPAFVWPVQGVTGAAALTPSNMREEIGGQIVLPEGTTLSTFSLTTALTGLWAIYWTEV